MDEQVRAAKEARAEAEGLANALSAKAALLSTAEYKAMSEQVTAARAKASRLEREVMKNIRAKAQGARK